ncbi:CDP-alcohol phosphatidyltransferase family protein [Candidatus Bathyarchaeota archaeon]|nr:CDP-alcohol phosphatidyltransferase family protein [Candidatus Bathyarchaeota archaeon]
MLTRFKEKIQSLLRDEAEIAYKIGLTPSHLSAAGAVLGASSGIFYWMTGLSASDPLRSRVYLFLAVLFLLASGFLDALDGVLARIYKEASARGAFLDSLLDRYVDSAVYLGIIIGGLCDLLWGILALIGSLLTSYVRARSEALKISMESVGVFERAERIILIVASSIIGLFWLEALHWGILILAIATNLTVLQRVIFFFKSI